MNQKGSGVGAVRLSPEEAHVPISMLRNFPCTKNIAEYKACIAGLRAALELNVSRLDVYGDSLLIICQTKGEWKTRDEKWLPYHEYFERVVKRFDCLSFTYMARSRKQFADALETLASMLEIPSGVEVRPDL